MAVDLRGVVPIIPTAFDSDGQVDRAATGRLVEFAVACGAHAVALPAFGSEFYKLGDDERVELIGVAARVAAGRVPVVAMANHPGLPLAVGLARKMAAAGADIIGLNLPRAFGVREDDLFRYAVAVAEATDLPFLVQDWNPGGGTVGPDFCVKLRARCPNFRWIKLEEPRMGPKMTAIHRATNHEVGVLEGWGGLFMPELMPHGCVGSMPGLAVCDVLVKVWDHLSAGDLDGAFGPFSEVMPYIYFSLENFEVYHHLEKRILVARGALGEAHVRDLTTQPDEYDTSYFEFLLGKLRETIERYGLVWQR